MITALGNNVIVRPEKTEEMTKSGIYLPNPEKKQESGEVVSVSEGVTRIKSGDKVIFAAYATIPVQHDGEELWFIEEKDVLGVVS